MSYIKFMENTPITVTLTFDEPLENTNQFGKKQFTYGIKEMITGEDKFSATEKLHEKIQSSNLSKGDTFIIEKKKDPELNKGYAFFTVNLPDVPITSSNKSSEPTVGEQQGYNKGFADKSKSVSVDLHELALRVEKLEEKFGTWSSEAGHKPGDEDIPF